MKNTRIWLYTGAFMVLLFSAPAQAGPSFDQWLSALRQEAGQKGISEATLNAALTGIAPIPRVIELDRKQPEGTMTFARYKEKVISQARIDKGRKMLQQHRSQLEKTSAHYGVPPEVIVALWGIETSYGENTGGFDVVPALATLAHDGRRSTFFRSELLTALQIIDEGHISAAAMKGSWAGAMGQNQFMPSSFKSFAVDSNNDGKRDIWSSLPDVFASTANYLSKSGWQSSQRWGRAVKIPEGFPESLTGLETKKSLQQWHGMGITLKDGTALPNDTNIQASLVLPGGIGGPGFLVYDNYRVIMKWNKSTYFATSVGLLSDLIAQ